MDPQRPSEWRKFQKGLCNGCFAGCCMLPVEASVSDLIRLGITDEMEAGESLKALAKRLLKSRVIQSFKPKQQIFVLAQQSMGECLYLSKERLCTVYERRPEVCRKFPKIGPRPGYCPAKPKNRP